MKRLLIVWHSRTGGSQQMAEAAFQSAQSEMESGCEVVLKGVSECTESDVLAADGYIFVGPENLAALSGEMKAFLDRCYYPVLGKIEGRPYAHLVCAGSDGTNAVRQLARIVTGWRLKAVQEPLIVNTAAQSEEDILAPKVIGEADLERCREIGAAMAAGLAMGVF
ncbi:MAG: NAD(P)H-dependent oxidoreductase [Pseudomonadota bacterium]